MWPLVFISELNFLFSVFAVDGLTTLSSCFALWTDLYPIDVDTGAQEKLVLFSFH